MHCIKDQSQVSDNHVWTPILRTTTLSELDFTLVPLALGENPKTQTQKVKPFTEWWPGLGCTFRYEAVTDASKFKLKEKMNPIISARLVQDACPT